MELDKKGERKNVADKKENTKRNDKSATYIYHDEILCEYLMVIAFQTL
jgi:hypothetical protein